MEKNTMLIADQSEEIRTALQTYFSSQYCFMHVGSGSEATDCIEKYHDKLAIIFLDVLTPNVNGMEVLQWLSTKPFKTIPVIAMADEESLQIDAIKRGAWDFITKRADGSIVKARVNNVLGRYGFHVTQMYDKLVNESKMAVSVSDASNYDLLYINDVGLAKIGKDRGLYIGKKCYEYLFNRTEPCSFCRLGSMSKERYLQRYFNFSYNERVYRLNGKLINWNGILAHVEYIEDVTESKGYVRQDAMLPEHLGAIIKNIPSGMCLYRVDGEKIIPLVHNKAFYEIFGYSEKNKKLMEERTNYLNVHPDDLAELKEKINTAIAASSKVRHAYRLFNDLKGEYIWIYLDGCVINQPDGTKLIYVSYTDISNERKMQENLSQAQLKLEKLNQKARAALDRYQSLINAIPGGIALYEVVGQKVLTRYYSDGLCELSGYSREERGAIGRDDAMTLVCEEDVPAVLTALAEAVSNRKDIDITYRIKTKQSQPRWVHLTASLSCENGGNPLYHAVFSDIDKIKQIEQQQRENQLRYGVAVKSSGINIWEYNIETDSVVVVSNSQRINHNCARIDNYVLWAIEKGCIREDCVDKFLSIFARLKAGEKEIIEDIWFKSNNNGWWCERIAYTTFFDDEGKPVKAFGAGRDVTIEKEAEKKFHDEACYREAIQSTNVASLKISLTNNCVVKGNSRFCVVEELLKNCTADRYFAKTAEYITGADNKKHFRETFNRQALINKFSSGEPVISMEISRRFETNKVYWLNYSVQMVQSSETKEIVAYVFSTDITQEKIMQNIMNTVANTDYEFFIVVDGTTNAIEYYAVSSGKKLFNEAELFEAQNEKLLRSCVCPNDVERVVAECKLDNVLKNVAAAGVHKFNFSIREANGEIRRKQLQMTMIDPERKVFLMSRIDVNAIFMEQEASKQKLAEALLCAERASHAKSDFFSQMSHEIRTPMNAIIGMTQLAMQASNNPETNEYLQKISSSSHYLLGIINDILDMRQIENEKFSLHKEWVPACDIFADCMAMVSPLLKAKNIDFEQVVKTRTAELEYYVDPLRTKQIVMNLLNNAAKFTPPGGNIVLSVSGEFDDGRRRIDRVTVSDTGCGMSQEFLRRIFEPFEQERNPYSYTVQGTGLGLALVKKIVTAVGGEVMVESTLGKGSKFSFTFPYEYRVIEAKRPQQNAVADIMILTDKNILLADDHQLNREIACKIMENKNMLVDQVENGQQAVELFAAAAPGHYDAILLDIRMPIMSGLEATRAIRALNKADAQTVPIIALTANAFDEDVKASIDSGMNAHLAKPIEPQKLYQTLAQFIGS